MSAFRYRSAAALVLLTVGSACPVLAQATPEELNSSHNLGTMSFPGGSEAELALLERLKNSSVARNLRPNPMVRPQDFDQQNKSMEGMLELLKKNGLSKEAEDAIRKNPALLKLALDRIKQGEGLPEGAQVPSSVIDNAMKDLEKGAAESLPRTRPANGDETPPVTPGETDRNPRQQEATNNNSEGGSAAKRENSRVGGQKSPDSDGPHVQFGPKLNGWAEKLQSINPSWRDSPAMQKAVQSLTESIGGEDPKWRKLAEAGSNLRERVNNWGKTAGLERFWPKGHFQLPDAPALERLPHLTNRAIADRIPRDLNMPQMGQPQASAGGVMTVLAWVVGIAAGAFCLRRFWQQREEANRELRRRQALQRAWPVDPQGVNNRDDLVRAYEYLALSRLGLVVRSWNHLAIAASLGNGSDPVRRNAALSLSDAYEHARYAPLEEALPGEWIAEARRHLCLLAGVSGS